MEETRMAMLSVIIEDTEQAEKINRLLHECNSYIIGRMGLPYQKRGVSMMAIAMDAPQDVISSLSGKIGRLANVTVKAVYAKI